MVQGGSPPALIGDRLSIRVDSGKCWTLPAPACRSRKRARQVVPVLRRLGNILINPSAAGTRAARESGRSSSPLVEDA